jgi:hypothetical protein
MGSPNLVLGYHGCERETGLKIIRQEERHLSSSRNKYDWLGHGVYFWENDPQRALEWATKNPKIDEPFVIGSVIDLGLCLDLVEIEYLELVRRAHKEYCTAVDIAGYENTPKNEVGFKGDRDFVRRNLDCAVINFLHDLRDAEGEPVFDSVRSPFPEGEPLYDGAGFMSRTHIQICVRNKACIKGYFHPTA